ncbi:hypothetical protein B0T26DRAFT_732015 [Lasiosphaeria miniovina]|uniref:Uncharacterized protein n=1 Tax=Lasiosphaeria miniovina TaxID=1954250 RepID=A0AA39ZU18_9PEZI|nr:uncharacterized protein B0T26DRAFT_732015 [Lasiosphaeria miniovina]KAK0703602.1 hypothetical protein B0T26DRAFT_732015 [Lasiosphaeria miniovina]
MKKSTRTLRFQGVNPDITDERLKEVAVNLCKKPRRIFSRSDPNSTTSPLLGTSITRQNDSQTATITYRTEGEKTLAYKTFRPSAEFSRADDCFDGITMLYGGNDEPVDIDICAVHGLDGHAFDTWMAESHMWLRDHLPHKFPSSRIMTFGYNSNKMASNRINEGLKDFADTLLLAIASIRTSEEQDCPVLFICHSMGGFVARLAVTLHWRLKHKYKSFKFGRYGLLFLSTPYIGSKLVAYSDLTLAFASLVGGVRSQLVSELRPFNPSLPGLVDDWSTITPQPIVRCLCESDLTKTMVGMRQVVDQVSAGFIGEMATKIPGTDHHTVSKIEHCHGQSWDIVTGRLVELRRELLEQNITIAKEPVNAHLVEEIRGEIKEQTQRNLDDQNKRDLLQQLESKYEDDKNVIPLKVSGTCKWFFTDVKFCQWRDSSSSSLLWFSAGPGCGKTVLSKALIDELSTNVTTSTVCYFFFKEGEGSRMHATNALCAILHQLFTHGPTSSLIEYALQSYKQYPKTLAQNFSQLWQILSKCADSLDSGEIICVLDALDECDADSRQQLLNKLEDFYCHSPSKSFSKLKFLITGRPNL